MKNQEKVTKKQLRKQVTDFLESDSKGAVATKLILATIALGGVVFVGAAVPGIIKAVEHARRMKDEDENSIKETTAKSAISRFKRDGYIKVKKDKNGKVVILLTEKGMRHVYDFTHTLKIREPLVWDRKWRVVIFDIPVAKRAEREMFRRRMKEMGFQQLQKSVWVLPYKCEDEVFFFAKQLKIVRFIEILTVKKLIHEEKLRKRFNL